MSLSCITKKTKNSNDYKSLIDKYDVSDTELERALYEWANDNERTTEKEGIDITRPEVINFLDYYFKVKSTNTVSSKELSDATKVYEAINKKTKYKTATTAKVAYNKRVNLFGKNNVVMYESSDRQYIVRVAKPIVKSEASKKPSLIESAKEEIKQSGKENPIITALKEAFTNRVSFDKRTHTYTVYPSAEDKNKGVNGVKATGVSKYIYGTKDIGVWGLPSSTIGNTTDMIVRDFFNKSLKSSYPNLTKIQLDNLISDLKDLENKLRSLHGKNSQIITEEIPLVSSYETVDKNGNKVTKYIAGTPDMIIIDEKGEFHIYDMKCKRGDYEAYTMRMGDKVNYGNQTGLYRNIIESYGAKFSDKNPTALIHFNTYYPGPEGAEYGSEEALYELKGDNLLVKTKNDNTFIPIQDSKEYSPIRWNRTEPLIPVEIDTTDEKMTVELSSLEDNDRDLIEEEFGDTSVKSSLSFKGSIQQAKSGLYNPILPATERTFLAKQVMQQLSAIVTRLQSSEKANKKFLGDSFANIDFTKMSREDIIETVGIGTLLDYVKEKVIGRAILLAEDKASEKLQVVYDNWSQLINEGYTELITLEGFTVERIKPEYVTLDYGDEGLVDSNETGLLEEKEREYWQLGQNHISAKSSLSKEIRRMFERLEVLDANGNKIADKYGYGLATFVDSGEAINSILSWCSNCTTIEEMEEILLEKVEQHPYIRTILKKIQDEPIRSMFFQNFRKDFTNYSIITVEKNANGKKSYVVTTVNTVGASQAILKSLQSAYNSASMPNIIQSHDEVEGKGKVNAKVVESIQKEKTRIYNRLHRAFGSKTGIKKVLDEETENITKLLNQLGIQVLNRVVAATIVNDSKAGTVNSTTTVQLLNKIENITNILLNNKDREGYNPMLKEEKEGNIYGDYKSLLQILEKNIESSIESSTYENGKMYYSFVTPSYMGKLIGNLKDSLKNSTKFKQFMKRNFSKYRWFAERKNNGDITWNNTWLQLLADSQKNRQAFNHKTQLSFDKTPYTELSELSYTQSLLREYFYDKNKEWAWYRVPILSNKPSSEFIKFKRFTGKNYKANIKQGLKLTFNQEILRIKTVIERLNIDAEKVKNFDINTSALENTIGSKKEFKALLLRAKKHELTADDLNIIRLASRSKGGKSGAEFQFLEMLNQDIYDGTKVGKLILDKINGKIVNESLLDNLLIGENKGRSNNSVIDEYMDKIVANEKAKWESIGLYDNSVEEKKDKNGKVIESKTIYKNLNGLGTTIEEIESNLEEYIWNDMFATINIIQLTVTDLAYYKNMEDFQKRYAQLHSPAMRLNETATYKGKRVSDGFFRTMYIKDSMVKSEIISNVKAIFKRKLESITDPIEKKEMQRMMDLIISDFENINVTDAQGYSSPTSYRKKMVMMGKWTEDMEIAYNRIREGNYDINDLGVVWQPLKPFVYTQISKSTGASTMSSIKVPIQNKNSEYMLLIADALLRSEDGQYKSRGEERKKGTLEAIMDFMEASAVADSTKGIDTIQFNSAVKSGEMGVIDINNMTYDEVINELNKYAYYNEDKTPSVDNDNDIYNEQYVHTIPVEDYGIQQEVPAHMQDHYQSMGSQVRILSISDISEGTRFKVKDWEDKNPDGLVDADYLRNQYEELIAANIKDSMDKLSTQLKLGGSRKQRNKALSEILIDAIKKDQRYGADLLRACSLDSNGEFIVPPCDPIQSQRIQQLINSIIKSRINKQEVSGGPVVQASTFGTTEELEIVFQDKKGNKIRKKSKNETDEEYQKYLIDNQASLAYMEVYMPIPSGQLEQDLMDENGHIMDIDRALEKGILNEEMLKAISYRIPTEDKYSIIPVKIKGFLPKAAGEAIMMPKEITLLTGSDFDIDKMYIMLKDFTRKEVLKENSLEAYIINSYKKWYKSRKGENASKELLNDISIIIRELMNEKDIKTSSVAAQDPKLFKMIEGAYNKAKDSYKTIKYVEKNDISSEHMDSRVKARNNKIFDIQWAVLTNEDTMNKMFNPGSFDVQKKSSRIIRVLKAAKTSGKKVTYKELQSLSIKQLDTLLANLDDSSSNNIIFSTTQVAFHKQNMTAGKLIGIFANNNTAHAFMNMNRIHLNMTPEEEFTIDGHTVGPNDNNLLDPQKAFNGSLISKNIAGFLAASVDAVKDPVLNFMNLNTFTSGPAMLLARLGFDSDTIGLLLTQPIIEKVSREYFKLNNDGYVSVEDVITAELNKHKDWKQLKQQIPATNFTKEDLASSIFEGDVSSDYQIKILALFKQLSNTATHLNTLTFLTKFNSISNAVGPTIADTLVMRERYNKFMLLMDSDQPPFSPNAKNIIGKNGNHPILNAFFEATVGDNGLSKRIFQDYFPHYSPQFTKLISVFRETTKSTLDSKTINKLVNDFIFYKLTAGPNPVISGSYDNRYNIIHNFPKRFVEQADSILDNALLDIIKVESSNNRCPVSTLKAETGGMDVNQQEAVKSAWADLVSEEDTFELGRDLFLYNLQRSGFGFSPKTHLHLASVDTKLAMGNYLDTVRDPNFNESSVNVEDFLLQFRRNHSERNNIVPELVKSRNLKLRDSKDPDGTSTITITIPKDKTGVETIIANRSSTNTTVAPVILYNGHLYYTNSPVISNGDDTIIYRLTEPLGNTNNFLEYDANDSLPKSAMGKKDLKSDVEKKSKVKEDDPHEGKEEEEVHHDKYNIFNDVKSLNFLFGDEGPLSKYRKEIDAIEEDDEANDRVQELLVEYIAEHQRSKIVKKMKEILDKFCK